MSVNLMFTAHELCIIKKIQLSARRGLLSEFDAAWQIADVLGLKLTNDTYDTLTDILWAKY